MNNKKKVLITGASGFIGFHLSNLLKQNNFDIIGIDNLNNYYDYDLKQARMSLLKKINVSVYQVDIKHYDQLKSFFLHHKPDCVINLAAQAGVRYSLENPSAYVDSNLVGFFNVVQLCKETKVNKLFFASSSSVYGENSRNKFSESNSTDSPLNLYAASKKSNELMAFSYSSLYGLPCIGLRFFTVYGPWGRPDMAYFKFTKSILEDIPINVYGNGDMFRDFTYIDDIVDGILKLIKVPDDILFLKKHNTKSNVPYRIFNIGNNKPVKLKKFIKVIEGTLGKRAKINNMPMQKGDVKRTSADIKSIQSVVNFHPQTSIESGIPKFVEWYKGFYR